MEKNGRIEGIKEFISVKMGVKGPELGEEGPEDDMEPLDEEGEMR